jgi:hypothetical protein
MFEVDVRATAGRDRVPAKKACQPGVENAVAGPFKNGLSARRRQHGLLKLDTLFSRNDAVGFFFSLSLRGTFCRSCNGDLVGRFRRHAAWSGVKLRRSCGPGLSALELKTGMGLKRQVAGMVSVIIGLIAVVGKKRQRALHVPQLVAGSRFGGSLMRRSWLLFLAISSASRYLS